jgi:uncharacterized protein (DUF1697 family)
MGTYIAMLRGINVSGQKCIKMEQLRKCFEIMGFTQVRTYVQSGNVVFEAREHCSFCEKIRKGILRDFGFDIPILLKSSKELGRIIQDNPFLELAGIDFSKLHVTFLSKAAPRTAREDLQTLAANGEQFHIKEEVIYLYCPNGYGRTKLSNTAIEKKLGLEATTRNWKSVNALCLLAQKDSTIKNG